jgi:hypothetical protein
MVDIWLFHPKNFLNFYTFYSKKFFWVLSGYMQPKKKKNLVKDSLQDARDLVVR